MSRGLSSCAIGLFSIEADQEAKRPGSGSGLRSPEGGAFGEPWGSRQSNPVAVWADGWSVSGSRRWRAKSAAFCPALSRIGSGTTLEREASDNPSDPRKLSPIREGLPCVALNGTSSGKVGTGFPPG